MHTIGPDLLKSENTAILDLANLLEYWQNYRNIRMRGTIWNCSNGFLTAFLNEHVAGNLLLEARQRTGSRLAGSNCPQNGVFGN